MKDKLAHTDALLPVFWATFWHGSRHVVLSQLCLRPHLVRYVGIHIVSTLFFSSRVRAVHSLWLLWIPMNPYNLVPFSWYLAGVSFSVSFRRRLCLPETWCGTTSRKNSRKRQNSQSEWTRASRLFVFYHLIFAGQAVLVAPYFVSSFKGSFKHIIVFGVWCQTMYRCVRSRSRFFFSRWSLGFLN